MVERQRVDQGTEMQSPCTLRHRAEKNSRGRRHAQRRRVMLGEMIGVEADGIVELDELEPCFVIVVQRHVIAIEMVENAKFHYPPLLLCAGTCKQPRDTRTTMIA